MEAAHRHQKIPELRHRHDIRHDRNYDLQRYSPGYRPVRQAELHKAETELRKAKRKAEKEELKKAEQAIAILGLSLLGNLLDSITNPVPVPVPTSTLLKSDPTKSDETIIDAEFEDIEDTETKALVLTS